MTDRSEKNKGVSLLLVNPSPMPFQEIVSMLNRTAEDRIPNCGQPIGLMDIAAYTRQHCEISNLQIVDSAKDIAVFYDTRADQEPIDYIQFLQKSIDSVDFVPDIVGISTMFNCSRRSSLEIARLAKEKWGDCISILGGNTSTGQYKELLEENCIDYVAKGEGEKSLKLFIDSLNQGNKRPDVQGIVSKKNAAEGKVENGPAMDDLTELSMPAFDLTDMDFYKSRQVSLMFSRGCPYPCTFCGSHVIHGRTIRFKSNEQCIAELKYMFDYGCGHIKPEDDLWATQKPRYLELVDAIVELKKNYDHEIVFELSQGLSVAVMDEERLDATLRMGCPGAQVAIESGSPYVQRNIIKKKVDLEKAKYLLSYMRRIGFEASVMFILGYPKETPEMRQETIDYARTLDVNFVYFFNCTPIMGADLYSDFEDITDMSEVDWDSMRVGRRVFDTDEITAVELENIVYDSNVDINFFNSFNVRNGRYQEAIKAFNFNAINNYPFHIIGRYCRAMVYLKQGRLEDATKDFNLCVEWIGKSIHSKKHYDRYGVNMPILTRVIEDGIAMSQAISENAEEKLKELDEIVPLQVKEKNDFYNGEPLEKVTARSNEWGVA